MPYQIIASEGEQCLIILLGRNLNIEHFMQMSREAGSLLNERQWNRIILDTRAQASLFSIMEGYAVMRMMADPLLDGIRMAVLVVKRNKQDAHFIKQFFYNHAIAFDVFSDVEEAVGWLFQNEHLAISASVCHEKSF
ncbi:MAG: hypothetical protein JXA82_15235 [Sedimentisphaerales bacterium]|nr:hypothetical protein [Sedimentisphaerales bacterium]